MGSRGSCARCGAEVRLHLARPLFGQDGSVGLWCGACDLADDVARAAAVVAVEPPGAGDGPAGPDDAAPARGRGRLPRVLVPATLVAVASFMLLGRDGGLPGSLNASAVAAVATEPAAVEPIAPGVGGRVDLAAPAPIATTDVGFDVDALEEQRPTLREWIHPVTGTDEVMPARSTARFGAHRDGVDRAECGEGHCGVDLGGPRGRPVVAVAWGIVEHVEHLERGRDGRSGRYVRIEHPDGVFTAYMHLDAVAAGLKHGDEVEPGQVIGTLGKTAIDRGVQHLHFALELKQPDGTSSYLDPAPFLERAQILPIPDQLPTFVPAAEDDAAATAAAGPASDE